MNKFLELSFRNHIRTHEEVAIEFENIFEPIMENLRDKLSKKACDEIEDLLTMACADGLAYAGVQGMELAIGVMNGTIQQRIE